MLHLTDNSASRRNFLSVGSLALGGLSLPQLLRAKDAVKQAGGVVKDRTVIFLFMHGGPSQTETFDPKMEAPSGIRSMTGEIPTRLPGVNWFKIMRIVFLLEGLVIGWMQRLLEIMLWLLVVCWLMASEGQAFIHIIPKGFGWN